MGADEKRCHLWRKLKRWHFSQRCRPLLVNERGCSLLWTFLLSPIIGVNDGTISMFDIATQTLKDIYTLTKGRIPLIGVGGISSAEDAYMKIRSGACLVQLYTALTYQGPGLVHRINQDLATLLEKDGFASISDAIGIDV